MHMNYLLFCRRNVLAIQRNRLKAYRMLKHRYQLIILMRMWLHDYCSIRETMTVFD